MRNIAPYLVALVLTCVIAGTTIYLSSDRNVRVQQNVILDSARHISAIFHELRAFYAQNVLQQFQSSDIIISHDYKSLDSALPIPATFSIDFSKEISAKIQGIQVALVSQYPFKFRDDRYLTDFDEKAIQILNDTGSNEFFEIRAENGRDILHYASSVRMSEGCVGCHNSHPASIKTNWSVGDLRGVQIIEMPINNYTSDIYFENALLAAVSIISFSIMIIFILLSLKVSRDAQAELEERMIQQERSEFQLRRAQKLDAIGKLSGGIAHDFNNLLGIIVGNLELAKRKINDNSPIINNIERAIAASGRGTNLTRKLLGFSRHSPADLSNVSVKDIVKEFEDLADQSVLGQTKIQIKINEDTPEVYSNKSDLEDAILNLVINGRDAMPNGGTLFIETGKYVIRPGDAMAKRGVEPGLYATIAVTDTGEGMSAEVKEQIFEPFFTTKKEGKGTGLGLSMIYGFVKRSKGEINVYSEPNFGSTFRIYLPSVNKLTESEGIIKKETFVQCFKGDECILIVDDEKELREIAVSALSDHGYRVFSAENGHQALQILESTDGIDLVLTDLVMPGSINGLALAEMIKEHFPIIKVCIASGFAGDIINAENAHIWKSRFLHKPYSVSQLSEFIRTVLDKH